MITFALFGIFVFIYFDAPWYYYVLGAVAMIADFVYQVRTLLGSLD